MLIHEATFSEEERDRAEETLHSTALQAAEIARAAGVRLLALTHISPRYFGKELAEEACAVFPATVVPRDFDVIEVPFAERGEPSARQGRRAPRSATRRRAQTCQSPRRRTGTSVPSACTPVTETSSEPIMKSMWIELLLIRPRSSSPTEMA